MLEINKIKGSATDSNEVKLIINTPIDALVLPKLEPKQVKPAAQAIQPEEKPSHELLFNIY
jgi:hypothetical protein